MSTWQKDIRVPLRDGSWLAGDLSLPEGDGPFPAILIQSPYGKERLGAALPRASARTWLDFWDRERYALLIVDWRGFYGSREAGDSERPKPSHRGEDGANVIEWMAAQPWCNERVAAWGPSALGRAVLRTAAVEPLPLVCGIPLVCHMGHFYEDLYEGGVLEEAHYGSISSLGFSLAQSIRDEPYSGTEFWRAGEAECRPEDINIPLLLVTGWFDLVTAQTIRFFTMLQARGGERARAFSRLLIGPWHHTAIDHRRQGGMTYPDAAGAGAVDMRAFLARWVLRDEDSGWSELTGVRFWQMGEERWIDVPSWPPDTTTRVLHLGADGSLLPDEPAPGELSFTADPGNPRSRDTRPTAIAPGPEIDDRIGFRKIPAVRIDSSPDPTASWQSSGKAPP
jgi:predicted acyl esterase